MTQSWWEAVRVYRNPRMLAILAMGFASGLPLALTAGTLQYWLTESGVSLGSIGLFSLVATAYTLKFLWSPVIDRTPLPWLSAWLGQRRAWLIAIELLLAGALVWLGSTDPASDPWRTALVAVVVAFLSASQDIVIDAYRIEVLSPDEQAAGAAATQIGYRIGMIASGAGALAAAEFFGWPRAYYLMAALLGVGVLTALLTPEPTHPTRQGAFFRGAVIEPFREFSSRSGWIVILVFVVLYRLGDALSGNMSMPFYVLLGFSKIEIAGVTKVLGVVASSLGILAGGAFAFRLGTLRALVAAGVIHAVSNLAFVVQAWAGHDVGFLTGTIFVENFTGGLVSAAFVGYLSGLCNSRFTATQYALFSSLTATGRTVLASPAGYLAAAVGWPVFFTLAAFAAVPGILLALWLSRPGVAATRASPASSA
jgi:PAT family beta-lactamase induction signal transducer AmpG